MFIWLKRSLFESFNQCFLTYWLCRCGLKAKRLTLLKMLKPWPLPFHSLTHPSISSRQTSELGGSSAWANSLLVPIDDKEAAHSHPQHISPSFVSEWALLNPVTCRLSPQYHESQSRVEMTWHFLLSQAFLLWTALLHCSDEFTQTRSFFFCWYFERWMCLFCSQEQVMLTPHHRLQRFNSIYSIWLWLAFIGTLIPNLSIQMAQRVGETAERQ